EARIDIGGVDWHRAGSTLARLERDFLEELFQHGVEAASADILHLLVHAERDLGQAPDRLRPELYRHAFGGQQRLVLAREARVGAGEDLLEVVDRERIELDAD